MKNLSHFLIEDSNFCKLDHYLELRSLLNDITIACKNINKKILKIGLSEVEGLDGSTNVHNESVTKLDMYSHQVLCQSLERGRHCAGVASEEFEDFIPFNNENNKNAEFVVLTDPLDGSSNIHVIAPVGTIFSVYKRKSTKGEACNVQDFLQDGDKQIAAGYVLYGSSTVLVLTYGFGVHVFTLVPSTGEFCISQSNIIIPNKGSILSYNHSHYSSFDANTQAFINDCFADIPQENKPYNARYIGSLVGDVHRNLLKGGVFLYPATSKAPNGKLRLCYEANPIAFIHKQAGGSAVNQQGEDILTLKVDNIHARCSLIVGSSSLIDAFKAKSMSV